MKRRYDAQTQLRTDPATLEALDKLAAKMELSRNQLMNNLLVCGVEDLQAMDRLGLIKVGVGVRNLLDRLREPEQQPLFDH